MNRRPYVLSETNWEDVRTTRFQLAVLPWGSTEAHNFHLPYATDAIHAELMAVECARLAWERGARVIVLPPLAFGVNTTQLDIPLTINMNPSTQLAVLADVLSSLERQGISRLVLFNGHGGNEFRALIRELQPRTSVLLCAVDWWRAVDAKEYFTDPGDHGGEMETSVMLHLAPDLVRPLGDAGPGEERQPRITALREGWAWMPRRWTQVTVDTGVGDPAGATADKGARFVAAAAAKIAGFLVELADADPEDLYEARR